MTTHTKQGGAPDIGVPTVIQGGGAYNKIRASDEPIIRSVTSEYNGMIKAVDDPLPQLKPTKPHRRYRGVSYLDEDIDSYTEVSRDDPNSPYKTDTTSSTVLPTFKPTGDTYKSIPLPQLEIYDWSLT
jgi:hypothetical protein